MNSFFRPSLLFIFFAAFYLCLPRPFVCAAEAEPFGHGAGHAPPMPPAAFNATSPAENPHMEHMGVQPPSSEPAGPITLLPDPKPGLPANAAPSFEERLGSVVPEGIFFIDDQGRRVDARSYMNIPVIVAPVFLTCPGGCNTLQSALAAVLPKVEDVPGKDYRVLVVSFDETDTPQLAARKKNNYLTAMNDAFPASELVYLTGDAESIKRFMDSIGFPFIRKGPGNFSHPLGLVVLAPGGKVTRYLYGQGFLPFDLNMALTEAAEGKEGLSIRRMVSYCFAYDPEAKGYVFSFMRIAGAVILFGAGLLLFILLRGERKRKHSP